MLHIAIVVMLSQVPLQPSDIVGPNGKPKGAPKATEMAKLYFLAGDIARAVEYATQGLKKEKPKAQPLLKLLAEYAFMANHTDEFTMEQARTFISLDHAISKDVPGKLTEPIIARFVTRPLDRAKTLATEGRAVDAVNIARKVLEVAPQNADATSLLKSLDAGVK